LKRNVITGETMKVLKERAKRVEYYNVPDYLIEFALWMIYMNYKPGSITTAVRGVNNYFNSKEKTKFAKNSYKFYERFLTFKNEIGWSLNNKTIRKILDKIENTNSEYIEKYGIEAIKISQEEIDRYFNIKN